MRSSSPCNPLTRNLCRSSCKFLIVSVVPSLLLLLPLFFIPLDFFLFFLFSCRSKKEFWAPTEIMPSFLPISLITVMTGGAGGVFQTCHSDCAPRVTLRPWQSPWQMSLLCQLQGFPHTSFCHVHVSPWSIYYCLCLCNIAYFCLEGLSVFICPPAATSAACPQTPWARRQSCCCQVYSSWAVFSASWRSLSLLSVLFCTSKHSFLFCRSMRWQWYCPPIPLATLSWCGALALAGHHKKNLCPFLLDGPYFSTHSLSSYLQSPRLLRKDRMVVFCLWYWSTSKRLLQSRSLQTNVSARWCLPKTTYNWSARQKTRRETTGSQHTGN